MKPTALWAFVCAVMLLSGCGSTSEERAFFNEGWMNPKQRDPGDTMARFPNAES